MPDTSHSSALRSALRGAAVTSTGSRSINGNILFVACLVGVAYYLGARLGFQLTFQPHPISVLWPPNSLLTAALLLTPARSWWLLVLAAFPAHLVAELQSGVPWVMVLGWFASNCSEALIAASAIRLLVRGPLRLDSLRHVAVFLVVGAFGAPLLSSFLDAALVSLIGWGEGSYWQLWRLRLFSNVLAAMTIVPMAVSWAAIAPGLFGRMTRARILETALVFSGLIIVSVMVFEQHGPESTPALLYAPLPFLLWAAMRLGPMGISTSLLVMVGLAIWGALHGEGPFVGNSPEENARSIQLFLIVAAVPLLLLAAAVAEREQAQRAIEHSEARADTIFRSNPEPIALTQESDGTLLDVNEKWEAMFGYSRAEVIGRTTADLRIYVSESDRQLFLTRQAAEGSVRDFETDMRRRDGQLRHAILAAERVWVDGTQCIVTAVRDVTEQRRVEREAREQQQQLAHLSRVSMLGELSGALAHELNQPLTSILSNAQAAQRFLAGDRFDLQEIKEILRDIADEDWRATEVIRRLRAMFRKEPIAFDSIDLNEVVQEALHIAHADFLTRGIDVRTRLSATPLLIHGDRVQLQQVLLNLAINACEAMRECGSQARILSVATERWGDQSVRLIVADKGPGLSPDRLQNLFEPFVTTKPHGLGLGLTISRSIVKAHGGRVWAANDDAGGAVFQVELPAHSGLS